MMMIVLRKSTLAALRVREAAFVEDLQQHVEDLGVRLLDLVEQDHAVRLAADGLGELAALFVADVAGRRADEARHVVPLHVSRTCRSSPCSSSLPNMNSARTPCEVRSYRYRSGPTKKKTPIGRRGSFRPARARRTARAMRRDRIVLADDAAVEGLLHLEELLRSPPRRVPHRDARPHGDDFGDVLVGDLGALLRLREQPVRLRLLQLVLLRALLLAKRRGKLVLLRRHGLLLLVDDAAPARACASFTTVGTRRVAHAHAARGLVDEVDRLVRQEPVGDVARRPARPTPSAASSVIESLWWSS